MMMGLSFLGPILPKFVASLGVEPDKIGIAVGLTITAFGVARVVTNIPAGKLTKRVGRRFLLVGAPVLVFISALGCGFTTAYWQLIMWRILQGTAAAGYSVAALIMLGEISKPSNRGLYISFFWTAALIGASIGPTFGGFMGEFFGYRTVFFSYAALALVSALWGYLRLPETSGRTRSVSKARPEKQTSSLSILKNHNFILISMVSMLTLVTVGGTQGTMIPLLGYERLSLGEGQLGLALTSIAIMQVLFSPLGGRLSDQWGRKKLIVPGGIITTLGLIMFIYSGNYIHFIISALILGFGRGIGTSVATTYVSDIALQGDYESTLAIYRAISDLGWVIGPLLCGHLKDSAGLEPPFFVTAGMLFIVILLFAKYGREHHNRVTKIVAVDS